MTLRERRNYGRRLQVALSSPAAPKARSRSVEGPGVEYVGVNVSERFWRNGAPTVGVTTLSSRTSKV